MDFKTIKVPDDVWAQASRPVRLGQDSQDTQEQVQKFVAGAHRRWLAGSQVRTWRGTDARYGLQTTGEHLSEATARIRRAGRDLGLAVRLSKPLVAATAPVVLAVMPMTRAATSTRPELLADDEDQDQAGTGLQLPGLVQLPDLTVDEYAALMDGLQLAIERTQNAPRRDALMSLRDKLSRFAGKSGSNLRAV